MKKISLIIVVVLILMMKEANSQNLIAVQNGNTPTFFPTLDLAIANAQNGDTVYIPGGIFNLTVAVDKQLHFIGVGHNPDSTLATGYTRINGNLLLQNELEASNGSICGVYLNGSIFSGSHITNYLVQRCRIGVLVMAFNATNANSNWSFIENVIQGSGAIQNYAPGSSNCFFSNNIIDGNSTNFYAGFISSVFKNNIFLFQSNIGYGFVYSPMKATESQFENNIFISIQHSLDLIDHSSFKNNIFVETEPFVDNWQECWGSDNIVGQLQSDIFVNQTGNNFSYTHDYHLQPTSPGKNGGKDGTDIGIYGGAFPWKAGSVPPNPHIRFENVSGVDDAGNIHVVVKVAAQDR